jgi:hypothetical protein
MSCLVSQTATAASLLNRAIHRHALGEPEEPTCARRPSNSRDAGPTLGRSLNQRGVDLGPRPSGRPLQDLLAVCSRSSRSSRPPTGRSGSLRRGLRQQPRALVGRDPRHPRRAARGCCAVGDDRRHARDEQLPWREETVTSRHPECAGGASTDCRKKMYEMCTKMPRREDYTACRLTKLLILLGLLVGTPGFEPGTP